MAIEVWISPSTDPEDVGAVQQTVTASSATEITFTAVQGTLPYGAAYLFVKSNEGVWSEPYAIDGFFASAQVDTTTEPVATSADGRVVIRGSMATASEPVISAMPGRLKLTGSAAIVAEALTCAASGTQRFTAALATAASVVAAVLTGSVEVHANASASSEPASSAGAGRVVITATIDTSTEPLVCEIQGPAPPQSIDTRCEPLESAAVGRVRLAAEIATAAPMVEGAAHASTRLTGQAATTTEAAATSATGHQAFHVIGNTPTASLDGALTGRLLIVGAMATELAPLETLARGEPPAEVAPEVITTEPVTFVRTVTAEAVRVGRTVTTQQVER